MNGKKVSVCIAVLLVALVSMSSIIYASQGEYENVKSDLTAAQSTNETQDVAKPVRSMFVQTAHSGSFVPVEGEDNLYILNLEGVSPQTIAFSDRPERVVEQVAMQKFLDGFCVSSENPPNAAIEVLEGNEEEDVMVVELMHPVYDDANQTLQYNVSILEEPDHSYAIFNERHDQSLPDSFGAVALFIDDCPDCTIFCCNSKDTCWDTRIGTCWKSWPPGCYPCYSDSHYRNLCEERFGADYKYPDYGKCGKPSD